MHIALGRIFLVGHYPDFQMALTALIQTQSQGRLQVVGAAGWDPAAFGAIASAHPDVIVPILGLEVGAELKLLAQLRAHAPPCRILGIDTLGTASIWQTPGWEAVDERLCFEQVATELVPAIWRLLALGDRQAIHSDDSA